jgi:katanin p60 ATPase-containing subunit A1
MVSSETTGTGARGACARDGIVPVKGSPASGGKGAGRGRGSLEGVARGTATSSTKASGGKTRPGTCAERSQGVDEEGTKQVAAEDPKFVEAVERDILDRRLSIQWTDIASLEDAKRLLQEAVVLPLLMPEVYTGIREPWKGVLLFGPPGTGKTMLAKAVASQAQTTFFNVSAATVISKFHGDSEKLVRALFAVARQRAPSTVFFDEIDAIMMARGVASEHEASRRVKGELLSQMDGIGRAAGGEGKLVMVLATTNTPWDLDDALLRRLEKRIYIPLPDRAAREELLRLNLSSVETEASADLGVLADRTAGYSGADLHVVCREASMAPMRRLTAKLPPEAIVRMKREGSLDLKVTVDDLVAACASTAATVPAESVAQYEAWSKKFSSV